MSQNCSFQKYIADRFDNEFWEVAERYLRSGFDRSKLVFHKLHRPGRYELENVSVEHIWATDCPGMEISFDVALSITLVFSESNPRYDDYEDKTVWLMVHCRGNLDAHLDDFQIQSYDAYNGKSRTTHDLDDSLVPYIGYDRLEQAAHDFLADHYPEALKITPVGQAPVWVDPSVLAQRLNLTVKTQRIREDGSVFGQIFFESTEAEFYDDAKSQKFSTTVPARTIVVDPVCFFLGDVGKVNNTIVHECVHWDKHRKAFALEKLFNPDVSCISCEVIGGALSPLSKQSTEFMEKQANQLTPRIQMPAEPFKAKAREYITKFMRESHAFHEVDVMENVITQLQTDFAVSRQAAKIRLVELGFETAIGTYTYLDGHYVKPHGFRKGAIKLNQTFSISAQDAAIERFMNQELRQLTEHGDYLFVDNHFVYNAPLYVASNENGALELTGYARAHMDECCLVFDMKITSRYCADYHTVCFLNREQSNVTFSYTYHNGYENAPQERQIAMRKAQYAEEQQIRRQMTDDPEQCMDLLLKWRGMDYTSLGDEIDRDPKTISRTVKARTTPKIETAVLICFGLHLPPLISEKLLEVLDCKLNPVKYESHQWMKEALTLMYPGSVDVVRERLRAYEVEI